MASEGEGVDSVEKMRIRMAAEGYNSMDNNNDNTNLIPEKGKSKSSACSSLEKLLTGLLVVSLIVLIALFILLLVQNVMCKTKQNTCDTPECVELSGSIIKPMDLSADPCDDFYEFACGRFDEDPLIPPEEVKYSWFSFMSRRSMALVKKLLSENGSEYLGEDSSGVAKARLFFQVCMNESATEATGLDPLLQLIADLGSWPLTNDSVSGEWSEASFDLVTSLSQLHLLDMDGLFSFGVGMDDKDTSRNRLQFDQSGLTFSDYTNYVGNNTEKYHEAFLQYFTDLSVMLGAELGHARQAAEDVWQFEKSLAKIRDTPDQRVDVKALYNLMTVDEFQTLLGDWINLDEYLEKMFGHPIPSTEQIILYGKNYTSKLGAIIQKTPKTTLATYLAWHVAAPMSAYLPESFQGPRRRLRAVLVGTTASSPLWLRCAARAEGTLPDVVGALYTEKYFTEEDKQRAKDLLGSIVSEFRGNLPTVDWMDDATRDKALEKIDALSHKIGYPEYIKQPAKLDKRYQNLTISNTNSFDNAVSALKCHVQENLQEYGQAPDPTKWSMAATQANAYYSPLWNEMVFPAGILNTPFYSSKYPMAMNYGSMGLVMGHELTHGFDNQGRNFDKEGNMETWWSDESAERFKEKTQCMVDQYNSYRVGDSHLNGHTTLGENIADNGGLKTSYRAYERWLARHGHKEPATRLPGLNLTERQLFFLSYAQTWCASYTPEYAERSLVVDVHSYAKYRVIGPLSNMPEFSDAFQCHPGRTMNPDKKCSVW